MTALLSTRIVAASDGRGVLLVALTALTALTFGACAAGGVSGVSRPRSGSAVVDDRPLVTTGPRCRGGICSCREVDATGVTIGEVAETGEAPIAEGHKRFELRTGRGPDEVRVTIEGRGSLRKSGEPLDAVCGYVDLPPGEHRVHLQVKASPAVGGASPKLLVYEHGARTHSWYASFGLTCGETAACTHGELEARMAQLARVRGVFDPCGSVKVSGLRWEADKAADERVTSLELDLVLKVYKFEPRFPRGGTCKGLSGE